MNWSLLIKRNLLYYWRTNLAVIFGVAISVAVLAGALLVGDSVRASLRDIFVSRLGNTSLIVFSSGFFREQLAEQLATGSCPLISLDAVVTHQESRRRGGSVRVYAIDQRFFEFNGRSHIKAPAGREALLSPAIAQEIGAEPGDSILVRVEKPTSIPLESLHGRKDDVARSIRLDVRDILTTGQLGEFSLQPQQGSVRSVFVPLKLAQRDLEVPSKVNAVLVSESDSRELIEHALKSNFALDDLGIKLRSLENQGCLSLESDSGFVTDALAEKTADTAAENGLKPSSILTYLVNTMESEGHQVPYSLLTALDEDSFERIATLGGAQLNSEKSRKASPSSNPGPILLNAWTARELDAHPAEVIKLEYYLWEDRGRLSTGTAEFRIQGIIPMEGAALDRDLVPDYPGITGSESLTDWDPPFPMELSRIRPIDEDYWRRYRTTPKGFIRLSDGQRLWRSRFGGLTSMRIRSSRAAGLGAMRDTFQAALRARIDPIAMGFSIQPARAEGLEASRGATDFGEYFLYFSFFLVVAALLLTGLFFILGIQQRLHEIGLLKAIGFSAAALRSIFLKEGLVLALAGSLLGLIGAAAYGWLMMLGLRTWWVGAVGTTLLSLHLSSQSLLIGGAAGIVTALGFSAWTLRRIAPASARSLLTGAWRLGKSSKAGAQRPTSRLIAFAVFACLGLLALVGSAAGVLGQVGGFFGAGSLLLIALLLLESAWLRSRTGGMLTGRGWLSVSRLGFRSAAYRPGRSILCIALIAFATFIIVAVDAFRQDTSAMSLDKKAGRGGFSLLAESLIPIVNDPNTVEGQEAVGLIASDRDALDGVVINRFRVRPGDDASCLNIYQPRNPRVLAPTEDFIRSGRFAFQDTLAKTPEEKANPWLLLDEETLDGTIPAIADANSMTYVLHKKLGDEIVIMETGRQPARLRLVAALSNSLLQGELLISEKNFLDTFPEQEGYRFFLIETPPNRSTEVAAVLEERLSDFGFDALDTSERLAAFYRVENTYLSTFQALGALGLMLGTFGLATILLRNTLERRKELALLRAVGYKRQHFQIMVLAENMLLLASGLAIGSICALIAILPAFSSRGGSLLGVTVIALLGGVIATGLIASLAATTAALRSPLLAALRAE